MRFCCMVVRRGPAVYDTMYGLTLYELISLRALLRLRGRRSVAALPAAPCAAWRPLLRRTAGTRAATALGRLRISLLLRVISLMYYEY